MNGCHICLVREATHTIKCKLCCDGWEHEACIECAQVYYKISATEPKVDFDKSFMLLRARRREGIAEIRKRKVGAK